MPAFCLSLHADYACRRSGACCTAGWPIHVEREKLAAWREAMSAGRLSLSSDEAADREPFDIAADLPPGAGAVLRTQSSGACVFYRGDGLCEVQRGLGHAGLPVACQHFPRRCLVETDRTAVSLSHFCPTVARLAFRTDVSPAVVAAPPSLVGHLTLEGLDAREALPPLLRPGMLADRDTYRAWEGAALAVLGLDISPEPALAGIAALTEQLRTWAPGDGDLRQRLDLLIGVGAVFHRATSSDYRIACRRPVDGAITDSQLEEPSSEKPLRPLEALEAYDMVRASVPGGLRTRPAPDDFSGVDAALVAPAWPSFSRPLRQFLAAHAFGNWCAYNGRGLRTVVRSLEVALKVVRVEAARACSGTKLALDEESLIEAFRAADLLLVHLADPVALAERLSAVEQG